MLSRTEVALTAAPAPEKIEKNSRKGTSVKGLSLLYISLIWTISGCLKAKSIEGVSTADLNASYLIYTTSGNTIVTCSAYISDSTNSPVILNSSDVLTCNGEVMTRSGNSYYATPSYSEGAIYKIVLYRPSEGSYVATGVMPGPATITAPAASSNQTKGQSLTVTWTASSNSTDVMSVSLIGVSGGGTVFVASNSIDSAPEDGTLTLTGAQTDSSPHINGTWSGSLTLARTQTGAMPSGLAGSFSITNSAYRSISLVD